MKETPMLFCGPMVRATLEDRKTVTRRLVKPQPGASWEDRIACGPYHPTRIERRTGEEYPGAEVFGFADDIEGWVFPYGRPGDHLWGKETFSTVIKNGRKFTVYRSEPFPDENTVPCFLIDVDKWKPSIFMPRASSRITLEILPGVRAERLQLITPEDCIAEGLTTTVRDFSDVDLRNQYRRLWNSLNLEPKPIKTGGQIVRYESYPWSINDFTMKYNAMQILEFRTKSMSCYAEYNGLPIDIYPNPYVWRIPFKRIEK